MHRFTPFLCTTLLLCGLPAMAGAADEPTLDEMLGLPAEESTSPEAAQADKADKADSPGANGDDQQLLEQTEQALSDYDQAADRFEQAIAQMANVSQRLTRSHDAKVQTQRLQEQIIRKLEQTIEAAKRLEQQRSRSSKSSKKSKPPRQADSGSKSRQSKQSQLTQTSKSTTPSQGQASPGSPTEGQNTQKPLSELGREWGRLPARLRNELSDGLEEPFSPVYRRMTEAYYRKLAEQSGQTRR